MPSPFPGMDPWLEGSLFGDLHETLAGNLREALNASLPEGYVATLRQIVQSDDSQRWIPDLGVFESEESFGSPSGGTATLTLPGLETLAQQLRSVEWDESYIEILSTRNRRLVTAIEILSPSNKKRGSTGREDYGKKQHEWIGNGVHLVEIDLLRGGVYSSAVPQAKLREICPAFDYHIGVTTSGRRLVHHGTAWKIPTPLPAIGFPLDPEVSPVVIDLQSLLNRAYDTGRYCKLVDYNQPPDPPLSAEQQAWAEGILKSKGVL